MNKQILIDSFYGKVDLLKNNMRLLKRDIQIISSGRVRPKIMTDIMVAVTSSCSQSCYYCFAKTLKKIMKDPDMKLEDFKKIVDWSKSQNLSIRFIGGEPTEHPNFPEMLDLCRQNDINFKIITNNLFDIDIIKKIWDNKSGLQIIFINYNTKKFYTKEKYQIFHRNLRILSELKLPFILYFNINKSDTFSDCEELIRDAKKYNSKIALCVTIPHKLDLDYQAKILIYIIENAKKANVVPYFIRPIPKCTFSEDQWKKLKPVLGKYYHFSICDFGPIHVNPDLTVFPCHMLSSSSMKGSSILSFKSVKEVYDLYHDKIEELAWEPLDQKCIDCKYHANHTCQAGCLGNKL